MKILRAGLFIFALLCLSVSSSSAPVFADECYNLENIPGPKGAAVEAGGLCFMPDGTLMLSTRLGEVWAMSPRSSQKEGHAAKAPEWHLFASGLHEPLGICAGDNGDVYVLQRPELTRLKDTTGKGSADLYETVCDNWGLIGFETEYSFGLVRDKAGNFWGALAHNWDNSPQMLYRGWSFKITPGGEFIPWSLGLRVADGVGLDMDGEVFMTDNQGEWFGASALHHITKDAFHGCPWFIQKYDKYKDVKAVPDELEKYRKLPAIQFPYDRLSRSPTQPLWDTTVGKFGPFAGQMFVGDHTNPVIVRVALEKVDGEYQGACFPFFTKVKRGNHRLAFAPDGSLYIGQTARGWLGNGNEGIQRLSWTGKMPFEIQTVALTADGFELQFTVPVDPVTAGKTENYALEHFYYYYHEQYGSPEVELTPVAVKEVKISEDHKCVRLVLPELKTRRIYALSLPIVRSEDGRTLHNSSAYYTLNRKLK